MGKEANRANAGTSKLSAEDKRKAFVEAFFVHNENITKAAIEAGFSEKTAYQAGSRLLKDVRVSTEIARRRTEIVAALELSTERTIKEVSRLAFSDPRKLVDENGKLKQLHELDDDTAAAVASYEVDKDGVIKYKFWDKNSAIEKAAKVQGLYQKDNEQKIEGIADAIRKARSGE